MAELKDLIGETLVSVECTEQYGNGEIVFTTEKGKVYKMYHEQDCCECVDIEDIVGDLADLVGAPLMMAEEVSGSLAEPNDWEWNADLKEEEDIYSYTWTFYKFATIKGYVTIRWYGESNGCYSESADFKEITKS